MMFVVVVCGLAVLTALAIVIGRASDGRARESAWRRIADARRINGEVARSNSDRQAELADWADELAIREQLLVRCANCPRRLRPPDHRS